MQKYNVLPIILNPNPRLDRYKHPANYLPFLRPPGQLLRAGGAEAESKKCVSACLVVFVPHGVMACFVVRFGVWP